MGVGMMDNTKIIMVPIDEIHPYENNPRNNDFSIERVKNSIRRFGFKQVLLLDKDNVIVVGHTRYRAGKELGYKALPCIISELSDDENKAYRLADNKTAEASTWDFEKLEEELASIPDIDMEDFGFADTSDIDWDDVPELNESTYQEPEKVMLRCPCCQHVDSAAHFIKVNAKDSSTEEA